MISNANELSIAWPWGVCYPEFVEVVVNVLHIDPFIEIGRQVDLRGNALLWNLCLDVPVTTDTRKIASHHSATDVQDMNYVNVKKC